MGRSIVVHGLDGTPYTSCIIKAVDAVNYFPVIPWPVIVKPCVSTSPVISSFICQGGQYVASTNLDIGPNAGLVQWEGYVFYVNGGIFIFHNSTLTVDNAELDVDAYVTLNDGGVFNLHVLPATSSAKLGNYKSYGGVFNVVDSTVTILAGWDESPLCQVHNSSAPPTPTGGTVTILPIPITQISDSTNISIGGQFFPCGHLQIDLKGGNYASTFTPFTYGSLGGHFTQISYFDAGGQSCDEYTITPTYNATKMSINIAKDSTKCLQSQTNLYIIIGIVVGAVVVALIIAIIVVAVTPAGIPCRIWYRRTCGSKLSSRGETQGF